ncbi:MAG TPA: TetR/AcrR family transcriptional regulator [Burkholderiaceae bacterium]|nr:TetR/AcrR family transcriptional regulator [Burkholderiaceae bacterium]
MEPGPFSGPLGTPVAPAAYPGNASAPPPSREDALLDAAEAVIVRDGIASLTLDAVAAQAGVSKGGLLHHFPNKDRLVEALVVRTAHAMRAHHEQAYLNTPEGPGRMARALLENNLRDLNDWCVSCRQGSAAAFAALAHNPSLIEPMRAAYADLYRRVAEDDGLPDGMGDAVVAAIDGLWLYWVLGLVPINQSMIVRVRNALQQILSQASAKRPAAKRTPPRKPAAKAAARTTPARQAPARKAAGRRK